MEYIDKNGKINVRLVNGENANVQKESIVGYCHYELHKGYLTSDLLEEHHSFYKHSTFLQRYKASYWKKQQSKEKSKRLRRIKKKQDSFENKITNERLEKLKVSAQNIADFYYFPIAITGVSVISGYYYSIHYISDVSENDWQKYRLLIIELKKIYKGLGFSIRHVKRLDGRYATFDDFKNLKRKR